MKNGCFLFLVSCIICTSSVVTQPLTLKVWPHGIPGSISCPGYYEKIFQPWGKDCFEKITDPEILVYQPPKEKSTGTAILICPGGGYRYISIVNEGYEIARWLNENGITAVILKYRLPSDSIMIDKTIGPLQDAQEAMRIIRRNAALWSINPDKIGIMGFSAGGHLASTLCTRYRDSVYAVSDRTDARPDFSILVYPVISMIKNISHGGTRDMLLGIRPEESFVEKFSSELHVTEDTPPAFLVHASDDPSVPIANSLSYYLALLQHHIPAEFHIYQSGGHGFGLSRSKTTESTWPAACIAWLKANRWIP
jgi:acetyl esterase/lipase